MTDRERTSLRKLQDRLAAKSSVKRFADVHGQDHPLWAGGPSYRHLTQCILPAMQTDIERYLNSVE